MSELLLAYLLVYLGPLVLVVGWMAYRDRQQARKVKELLEEWEARRVGP